MSQTKMRYYIQTYGCQMNVADSDRMAALLEQGGGEAVEDPRSADVILLNTCSVRERPEHKVYSRLGELRRLKKRNPDLIIGVCGCQAQREGEAILEHAPFVDLVVGTANVDRVPELVRQVRETRKPLVALEMPERGKPAWLSPEPHMTPDLQELIPATTRKSRLKAFVPVILGCDYGCTFCIVPRTRGPERSRPVGEVLGEIRALAQSGTKEVMLLGQTVDAYRSYYWPDDPPDAKVYGLAELMGEIEGVDGIERVRFTSPHPNHMSPALIEAIARLPKACEWVHLPVQSGDNEILRRMARRYTREKYLDLVRQIRAAIPEVSITTDIIVGFPGETRDQFEHTLSLMEEVGYDGAYVFAYSPRPGTAAFGQIDDVARVEKHARVTELVNRQLAISREKNAALLGETYEVLVEGPTEDRPGQYTGLTRNNRTVNFPGWPELVGQLVPVTAIEAHPWGFMGQLAA
jgi:tRNA-2-methylthio-N6-dimethylallyladenosine synthase